jgi:hypothetical protein
MKENGVSLNFEKAHFSYVKEKLVKKHLSYQLAGTLEFGRGDRRPKDTDIPTVSYTGQHYVIIPADYNLSVSLSETRDLQSFSLLQSKLTGKCDEVDFRVEASGRADKASNVLTPRRCMQPVLQ